MKTGPELLRAVADIIEESPERYDQGVWLAHPDLGDAASDILREHQQFRCNTTACIAGWAVAIHYDETGDQVPWVVAVRREAAELLGLSYEDADVLFDTMWRPASYLGETLTDRVANALREIADGASVESVTDR